MTSGHSKISKKCAPKGGRKKTGWLKWKSVNLRKEKKRMELRPRGNWLQRISGQSRERGFAKHDVGERSPVIPAPERKACS